jgi:phosphoglycolate phosphatase-like HAD superfamily hydrolase
VIEQTRSAVVSAADLALPAMDGLELLSIRWRSALDAAEDALDAVSRSRQALQFDLHAMQAQARELVHERTEAETELGQLARLLHTAPRRSLVGPRASCDLLGLDRTVVACVFDLDGVVAAHSDEVSAFDGSIRFLEIAHEAGLRCAVVSASANTEAILERAGLISLVDEVVDGDVIDAEKLKAKPAPDSVLAACRRLDIRPESVATFETTVAGVAAGRAAGVHRVIGIDRPGRGPILVEHGADRTVSGLSDLIDPALSA